MKTSLLAVKVALVVVDGRISAAIAPMVLLLLDFKAVVFVVLLLSGPTVVFVVGSLVLEVLVVLGESVLEVLAVLVESVLEVLAVLVVSVLEVFVVFGPGLLSVVLVVLLGCVESDVFVVFAPSAAEVFALLEEDFALLLGAVPRPPGSRLMRSRRLIIKHPSGESHMFLPRPLPASC